MRKKIWIKVFNTFLCLLFMSSCDRNNGKMDLASVLDKKCDEAAMRDAVRTIFLKWASYPSYVTRTIAHSAYQCFGPVGFDIEIQKITSEILKADVRPTKRKNRDIASKSPAESYQSWVRTHDDIEGLANTLRIPGYAGKAGLFQIPLKISLVGAAAALDQVNKSVAMIATSYAKEIIKRGFDPVALQKARSSGRTPEERQQNLFVELKKETSYFADSSQFLDHDGLSALDAGLEGAIKLISNLQDKADASTANIDALKQGYAKLRERQERSIEDFNTGMKSLGDQMAGIADELSRMSSSNDEKFNFLFALQENSMTAEQKIYAIQHFGYGNFNNGLEKEETLRVLDRVKKYEETEKWISNISVPLGQVDQILNNLGIHSKELGDVVAISNKVQTVSHGLTQLAGLNILQGLSTITSVFAGGGNAEAARQQQIMNALNHIMELQRRTIELQIQTIKMVESLSHQIEEGFNSIHKDLGLVIDMQQLQWRTKYQTEVTAKLDACRAIASNYRKRMIETTGVSTGVLDTPYENSFLIDQMAFSPFPALTMTQLREIAEDASSWQSRPNECFDYLRTTITMLASNFERHLQGEPITTYFLQAGQALANDEQKHSKGYEYSDSPTALIKTLDTLHLYSAKDGISGRLIVSSLMPVLSYRNSDTKWSGTQILQNRTQFSSEQESLISRMRANLFNETKNKEVYDPIVVGELVESYLNLMPLSYFQKEKLSNEQILPHVALDPIEQNKMKMLVKLIEFVVAQQAVLSGEAFLPLLSGSFGIPPRVAQRAINRREDLLPQQEKSSRILADDGKEDYPVVSPVVGTPDGSYAQYSTYELATTSTTVLYNIIRYRLVASFRDRPAPVYAILYRELMTSQNPDLFNSVLSNKDLKISLDGGKIKLGFNFKDMEGSPLNKFSASLPTPEEFDSLPIAFTSNIVALLKLRDDLLRELYHFSLAPKTSVDVQRVAETFKKMAI